jgi:hypothetical protein
LVVDAGMVFRVFGCVVSSSREIGHVLQTLAFGRIIFAEEHARCSCWIFAYVACQFTWLCLCLPS